MTTSTLTANRVGSLDWDSLRSAVDGRLVTPADADWQQARTPWVVNVDQQPAAVLEVANVADVVTAVRWAIESDISVTAQPSGHAPRTTLDDTLLLRTRALRGIAVDVEERSAVVGAGVKWGELMRELDNTGLIALCGSNPDPSVVGLLLGGGVSWFTRAHGFTANSVLSVDLVTPQGELVHVTQESDPELFWALRGGGGNFGIVTSFTFRGHDVANIFGGPVLYDIGDTGEVLRWYRDLLPTLPRELSGWFGVLTIPPAAPFPEELWGRKACGVVWCYTGDLSKSGEVFKPLTEFGSPLLVGVQEMPFPILQSAFDALYPKGLQWYWRADFFREITDEAIAAHEKFGADLPTGHSTMHLYPIDGRVNDVGQSDTAFAYRDVTWGGVIVGVDPDPNNAKVLKDWVIDYWEALHPTSAGGAYVNMMMDEGQERIRAAYGPNYERLAAIKRAYDPDNVFHVNQNIQPR